MCPLLLLTLWQIKNTLLHTLRSPKKLAPLLLMAAYTAWMWWMMGHTPAGRQAGPNVAHLLRQHRALFHTGLFLSLTLFGTATLERGFVGGSLHFVPADVDYLFAAPFSRRLVLLFKVGLPVLATAAFAVAMAVYSLSHTGHGGTPPGWVVWGAFGACLGVYFNLAVALELAFGMGRWPWGRRAISAALLLIIAYVGVTCWQQGAAGLARISEHGPLPVLFYPCRLAADVGTAALGGRGGLAAVWGLLVCYALSLALVFSRNENYYEPALSGAERQWRDLQAQQENPWHILRPRAGARRALYSLRPFGRGAGALFWAHGAAAFKTPFASVGLPLLAGAALAALTWRAGPENIGIAVGLFTFYYFAATTVFSGIFFFRRALQRQALIRPLPLLARGAVLAEVGPRTALAALFYPVVALGIVLSHGTVAAFLALTLLGLPLASLCLNLLQFTLALWYPSTQDKVQDFVSETIQLVITLLLMTILASLLAVPVRLGAPGWLSLLVFFGGSAWTAGFLLALAAGAYAGYQPEGGPVAIDRLIVRRYLRPAFLVAVLALIGGVVVSRITQARNRPKPPPLTVRTHRGDIAVQVREVGTLTPEDKVDVRSKVAGRILTLSVAEGQSVRAGQLIATVDRTLLDPQVAQAQAQLTQEQARLTQTVAAYRLQVAQTRMAISQARADLATARANLAAVAAGARPPEIAVQEQAVARARIALADAERAQRRKQALRDKGFLAQSDADAAQVAADTARSNWESARQALRLTQAGPRPQDVEAAQTQVDAARIRLEAAQADALQNAVSKSDIAQARAGVQQAAETLSQLQVSVHDTRLVAPTAGLVLKTYKQPGEIVQSATTGFSDAQSLVVTLGRRLMVQVEINEVDIAKLKKGAPVTVRVDAVPGKTFPGVVTQIAPASTSAFADSGGGGSGQSGISKFPVKIALTRYDSRLRPGMSAGVSILCARHRNVVIAPLEAMPFAGDQGVVKVWMLSGRTKLQHVRLGLRNDREAEVVSGLRAGELLVVSGRRQTAP
ncbi:MAG: HlyD family efflux transporter periplasmic adaptor subunit [Armatimonadetes bacterium]|nr:HlyD family efflux transporter periplasmic adaptor subunit [Armatimonadota bacterium]